MVNTFDEDAVKRRQRAQQVALFRYQLICPALEPGLSTKQRGKVVRGIAGRSYDGPFGGQVRYAAGSQHVDVFVLVSGDGGFVPLVRRLHALGKYIMVATTRERAEQSTSKLLQAAADHFLVSGVLALMPRS